SWHEGFGLPVLEAMSCGKAVIGSNCSSIPEVIGYDEALFDPMDITAIKNKMLQVLTAEDFKKELEKHSLAQSKNFSWDQSGKKAIEALEKWYATTQDKKQIANQPTEKPKLAYFSPLPLEKSGISDYSAELIPVLSKYYEIDVIVDQPTVEDAWIKHNCNIRTIQWFKENYNTFDRVLYHFGNSHFHQHMFDLLKKFPGIVVLHDFYLSGVLWHMEWNGYQQSSLTNALIESHGYNALKEKFHLEDISDVIWKYPANLEVLQNAFGVIVHSENSIRLVKHWYCDEFFEKIKAIPLLRISLNKPNKQGVKQKLLLESIKKSKYKNQIIITGWVSQDTFRDYLSVSDIAVQLRTLSRGETSAAVLDCMNFGIPTIANANGSMADL
ncbi:MAG: glycosyltransferase, partial [Campylobacteraceae bacterium]|nr:glycosyltransferase [Campylobacteraceae bacterium]